jgi:pimeloyl-ACP methyl ester carboxylesterase
MQDEEMAMASVEIEVRIPAGDAQLLGTLALGAHDSALVIFAHGSGSSRNSPRNREVAQHLRAAGMGTLLFDMLTPAEEAVDRITARLRFDIPMLAERLEAATEWAIARQAGTEGLAVGYFGASTGAAAALIAASRLQERIGAVVSRGGRPDLAGPALARVASPTLLIVGELDPEVHVLNEQALSQLECDKDLVIVPSATHLFEEAGALEEVSAIAAAWFRRHLLGEEKPLRARAPRGERKPGIHRRR